MDEARLRPGYQFGSVYVCVFVSALTLFGDRKGNCTFKAHHLLQTFFLNHMEKKTEITGLCGCVGPFLLYLR